MSEDGEGEFKGDSIKVALLGDSGVGKTCIIKRYTEDTFNENSVPTQGASYFQKLLEVNNKNINLDIWDTAGQERYRSLGRRFYKEAYIVCLVYDITSSASFENLKNVWYKELKDYGEKFTVLGIVGNKSDLYENEEVNDEEVREYAKTIDATFVLTSAKKGDNIDFLFDTLTRKYLGPEFTKKVQEMKKDKGEATKVTNSKEKENHKKKNCC